MCGFFLSRVCHGHVSVKVTNIATFGSTLCNLVSGVVWDLGQNTHRHLKLHPCQNHHVKINQGTFCMNIKWCGFYCLFVWKRSQTRQFQPSSCAGCFSRGSVQNTFEPQRGWQQLKQIRFPQCHLTHGLNTPIKEAASRKRDGKHKCFEEQMMTT